MLQSSIANRCQVVGIKLELVLSWGVTVRISWLRIDLLLWHLFREGFWCISLPCRVVCLPLPKGRYHAPIMLSERVQRRIDRLLDQAEEAADQRDWQAVLESVRGVISVDPDNEDAASLGTIAEAALGDTSVVLDSNISPEVIFCNDA